MSGKMNCEQTKDRLDEYLDGELSADDAAAVEQHLAGCEACRAELEALRKTAALVKSLPRVKAPEGLASDVKASLARRTTTRRSLILRWASVGGWLAAAATLIIVIKLAPWEGLPEADRRPAVKAAPELERKDPDRAAKLSEEAAPAPGKVLREAEESLLDKEGAAKNGAPAAPRTLRRGRGAGSMERDAAKRAAKVPPGAVQALDEENGREEAKADDAKEAAILELLYECTDVKTGLVAVNKALKALEGRPLEGATADGKAVLATIPREKLAALIKTLKLVAKMKAKAKQEPDAGAEAAQFGAQKQAVPEQPRDVTVKIFFKAASDQ